MAFSFAVRLVVAVAAGALLCACGPQFDRPSEVKSLRVIAVQKDRPYAAPGDDVKLKMLWTDGSEDAGRPIQIAWISGCFNPLGDLYQGCFARGDVEPMIGFGDEFSLAIPADIISSRPPPPDPRLPPYGLSYVFFAACAGSLEPASGASAGFPLRCVGASGQELDSRDFVAGYSAIYVYDDFRNRNAIVRSLTLDGKPLPDGCIDPMSLAAAESGDLGPLLGRAGHTAGSAPVEGLVVCDSTVPADPPEPPDCSEPDAPCLPPRDPGNPLVYPHDLRPEVYASSVEHDEISEQAYGTDYEEQMWINYYVTNGSLGSDVRLLNDATTGLNKEFHTQFYPPTTPGPVTLWAVVHDNRGGVAWARGSVWVQ